MALTDNLVFYASPNTYYPSGATVGAATGASGSLPTASDDSDTVWDATGGNYADTYSLPAAVLDMGAGDFTIAARFRLTATPSSSNLGIACFGPWATYTNYPRLVESDRIGRKVGLGETYSSTLDESTNAAWENGANYYTVIAVRASSTLSWYRDDGTDISNTGSFWGGQNPNTDITDITIGGIFRSGGLTAYWPGYIAWVAAWERAVDPTTETVTRAAIEAALGGGGGGGLSIPVANQHFRNIGMRAARHPIVSDGPWGS